jgi:hypothetical protein
MSMLQHGLDVMIESLICRDVVRATGLVWSRNTNAVRGAARSIGIGQRRLCRERRANACFVLRGKDIDDGAARIREIHAKRDRTKHTRLCFERHVLTSRYMFPRCY